MRFIDRETPAIMPPTPWRFGVSTITFTNDDIGTDTIGALMAHKFDQAVRSTARMLDNMMFWWPAREQQENGGCRR